MNLQLELPFQLDAQGVDAPSYAHPGDAGFDLRASAGCELPALGRCTVPTGLRFAIPAGFAGLVRDRSGLAARHGIHCLAGVIDSGYRGEVKVVLQNLGEQPFTVEKGMRIAQLLLIPVAAAALVRVEDLDGSSRGEGGFGSTGLQ
ncbi:MAG: dUTP diphosphatase [Candidatus Glassbacteria bacterium]|nr:dUTP diphosphatase [Candidatus Glassbacteria bacterium]